MRKVIAATLAAAVAIGLVLVGSWALGEHDRAHAQGNVHFDVDPEITGNTASTLGTVERCYEITVDPGNFGDGVADHTVDVIVTGDTQAPWAYHAWANYDQTLVHIVDPTDVVIKLTCTPESHSEARPDSDGQFKAGEGCMTGEGVASDGTLVRLGIDAQAAGVVTFSLANSLAEPPGTAYRSEAGLHPVTRDTGKVAINQDCPPAPTPTPTPQVKVLKVSVNYGTTVIVPDGRSAEVTVEVKVKFTEAFKGRLEVRLVDADTVWDDLMGKHEFDIDAKKGEEVTLTFKVKLKNDRGTIKGEEESSGEGTCELGVEVGTSSDNYYDSTWKNRYVPAQAVKKDDLTKGVAGRLAVELTRSLICEVDASGQAAAALAIVNGIQTMAGLTEQATAKGLLRAYLSIITEKNPILVRVAMTNFAQQFYAAAGLDIGSLAYYVIPEDWVQKVAQNATAGLYRDLKTKLKTAIEDPDADGDGFDNEDELTAGSDPYNAASTPEHSVVPGSCNNSLDDDGDGYADLLEPDGPDHDDLPDCLDSDGDTIVDFEDNCPSLYNPGQEDADDDAFGDACDAFPLNSDEFKDSDGDGMGDNEDPDDDNDGWPDEQEFGLGSEPLNSLSTPEDLSVSGTCSDEQDNDLDDVTEPFGGVDSNDWGCLDGDSDGIPDYRDNCLSIPNTDQANNDLDPLGDACDDDDDNDGLADTSEETTYGTSPLSPDTEGDHMPDGYEVANPCLSPLLNDGPADPDGDGFSNIAEHEWGTDPCNPTSLPPLPVGGIVELLVGGSDAPASAAEGSGAAAPLYTSIAGGLAVAALALAAGGWYARRRWPK